VTLSPVFSPPSILVETDEVNFRRYGEKSPFYRKAALKIKYISDINPPSFPWGRFPSGPASANSGLLWSVGMDLQLGLNRSGVAPCALRLPEKNLLFCC
jgi:hypothetical protein